MKLLFKIIYVLQLVVVGTVIIGLLPRIAVLPIAGLVILFTLLAPLEDALIFFAISIPLFVALPLTAGFDSLNVWRIVAAVIFIRWLFKPSVMRELWTGIIVFLSYPRKFISRHRFLAASVGLLLLACLSVVIAGDRGAAIKKIILFVNLSMVGIVAYDLCSRSHSLWQRLLRSLTIPVIVVTVAGFAQLIMTYFYNIYEFLGFWSGAAELNLYGQSWSQISLHANTWFAYFGDQLSLRMFSTFPDSHSFPIFLILGLPTVFAVALAKLVEKHGGTLKELINHRGRLAILLVPLIYLAMILTGTRGIWAASAGVALAAVVTIFLLKKHSDRTHRNVFTYLTLYLLIFFMLFAVAWPIFASNQFEVSKDTGGLFAKRVHSIIDLAETSNAQRILIWKASVKSIMKHPLLGVGIGNFPVVLGEDISLAKAGASAHDLYLHLAAELGLGGLILGLYLIWLLFRKVYQNYLSAADASVLIFNAVSILSLAWVFFYLLTDVAIFDERAFLMFTLVCALVLSLKNKD